MEKLVKYRSLYSWPKTTKWLTVISLIKMFNLNKFHELTNQDH